VPDVPVVECGRVVSSTSELERRHAGAVLGGAAKRDGTIWVYRYDRAFGGITSKTDAGADRARNYVGWTVG
jgi:hypothetical protein